MSFAAEVRDLRTRALAELTDAHDYHSDTLIAWGTVGRVIARGETIAVTNTLTGTVTTDADLVGKIRGYTVERLPEATFQTFLTVFEAFFADFVRAWLRSYPESLRNAADVPVGRILDAADKSAVVEYLIDRAVVGLLYEKPVDWFAYLEKRLKLGCPSAGEVARFAEAKATRDILIHNRGVVNEAYLAKVGKNAARFALGERVDVPEPYHRETWDLLRKMVADLSDAVTAKFP
ncbi:MAG: hypothetical protein C0501_17210 [Isosphaera sp.]|nr:hypothetical protein [Isosphaera sp.]